MVNVLGELWVILPALGIALGGYAIWSEYSRQKKALDVLRIHAERGIEPSEAVLDLLSRASGASAAPGGGRSNSWADFAFYMVMAAGFAAVTWWFLQGDPQKVWFFVVAFGIAAFSMAAFGLSALIAGLTAPRKNER
jgi:hypothetical protein